MDTYGRNPGTYVADALEQMREIGATYLEAWYEGGNDEGGITGIKTLRDKDGNDLTPPENWVATGQKTQWNTDEYKQDKLYEALDNIMSTKYGTWCGEFHAYGLLKIDVATGKAWTDGEYEVMTSYDTEGIEVNF